MNLYFYLIIKMKKTLLILIIAALAPVFACAQDDIEIDGVYYFVNLEKAEAHVYGCDETLEDLVIPSSIHYNGVSYIVTDVGVGVSGRALKSIVIPNSVKDIGPFYNCTELKSVSIGTGVESIGYEAFNGCSSLESIVIPDNVQTIGEGAFRDCSSLKTVTLSNQLTDINGVTFYDCTNLKSITIPEKVTYIGDGAFSGSGLEELVIPNGVTSTGWYVFEDCKALQSVVLGDGLEIIENDLFRGCENLTSVRFGNNLGRIKDRAFEYCRNLISVDFPASLQDIDWEAFSGYSSLTTIKIPDNSYFWIGSWAFNECIALKDVFCYAVTPPSCQSYIFGYEPSHITENGTLHVPAASIEKYKIRMPWMLFGTIVALTDEDPAAVDDVRIEETSKKEYYDLQGRRLDAPVHGINIIRYPDGTTSKIQVK